MPKKGRGWHSLRRKFASDFMHQPLKILCELGGWKSPRTILTCYQQPNEQQIRAALSDRRRVVNSGSPALGPRKNLAVSVLNGSSGSQRERQAMRKTASSHRGRTSPRVRVRPVPAPRVRRLRHLPPTVLPDRLSHSATSTRPAEHPHLPFHPPSAKDASLGHGERPPLRPLPPRPISKHHPPRLSPR